ncbi:hypothetical protein ACFXPN_43700 [Streptomyces griseorubiginosus]|uniref:hypothetical protein n=1 Tax=Streptomyces griseorubiginosus TaxID=67304 RepID=UPI0036CCFFA0
MAEETAPRRLDRRRERTRNALVCAAQRLPAERRTDVALQETTELADVGVGSLRSPTPRACTCPAARTGATPSANVTKSLVTEPDFLRLGPGGPGHRTAEDRGGGRGTVPGPEPRVRAHPGHVRHRRGRRTVRAREVNGDAVDLVDLEAAARMT